MRKLFLIALLALVAACGSSTEPKTGDPSLLVTNDLTSDWVYITWQDGNAVVGRDSVPPRAVGQCIRFTAQPDSAYFQIVATEHEGTAAATSTVTAPWFNPADRPAWTVLISRNNSGSPTIRAELTDSPC